MVLYALLKRAQQPEAADRALPLWSRLLAGGGANVRPLSAERRAAAYIQIPTTPTHAGRPGLGLGLGARARGSGSGSGSGSG